MDYDTFIENRMRLPRFTGIDPAPVAAHLFPFQRDIVRWALKRGRAAIFADTGLGKTAMQLEWARQVSAHGSVLILCPLAVADQTVAEGARFGVDCEYTREQSGARIQVTNYEMLDRFNPADFVGVVIDESSILKAYTGKTRNAIIGAFADTPYRLACTATPAPNDHTELGNHSEFLGVKSRVEMLSEYFVHDGGSTQNWRLKGHARSIFWRWVCSWGVVLRVPSDLGYEDGGYALPELRMHEHVVPVDHTRSWGDGLLIAADARTLAEQRRVRRETMIQRVQLAAEIATSEETPCLIWCELNAEGDALAKAIGGSVQIRGSDRIDDKRARLLGFPSGEFQVLITKPSIAGFGMNWQHCARVIFVGASHSYEQTYQAIRRCWRFGQSLPVDVHVIRAETESAIVRNFERKQRDHAAMIDGMVAYTSAIQSESIVAAHREWNDYQPSEPMRFPAWLHEGGGAV